LGGLLFPLLGPIVGAGIMTMIPEVLRAASVWASVITGAILVILILFFPYGFLGLVRDPRATLRRALRPASDLREKGAPYFIPRFFRRGPGPIRQLPGGAWDGGRRVTTPLLDVEGLTKQFGGLVALTDVSFQVAEHEVLGVIGPNGAGKSTLLNVIAGVYEPTRGRVVFADADLTGHKAHDVARVGIAHTFQSSLLFHQLPVIDTSSSKPSALKAQPGSAWRLPAAQREEAALRESRKFSSRSDWAH
jgi:hypothetical protein